MSMSLSKELNALKEKAEEILKELQMNCSFNEENYDEALEQLTAIDGWTESQSTDEGYAEGYDRYASQERRVEEMKARLDKIKAENFTLETFLGLVFETDCIIKLERNILPPEVLSEICTRNNVNVFLLNDSRYSVKEMFSSCISPETDTWQAREILALLKSLRAHSLAYLIRHTLKHPLCDGRVNTYPIQRIVDSLCELQDLDYLEEVVTLGMLDVYINQDNILFGYGYLVLDYMVNHDFGKDVGIDFKELRYQKAQAEKAKQQAELNALMGFK